MTETGNIREVEPARALAAQQQGAVLLDVREPDEWTAGHAPGALHVPLAEVDQAVDRFVGHLVLPVCRSGGRSAIAAKALASQGLQVRNVAGGMTAWAAAGLPVVCDDGTPGAVA